MKAPTAQTLLAEAAATADSAAPMVLGRGLAWRDQRRPFQCRINGCSTPLPEKAPTAHAFAAEVAVTPCRPAPLPALGLVTRLHMRQFQCRIRDLLAEPLRTAPTAHAFLADTVPTAVSTLSPPGLGLGTCRHLRPFQCRIRVRFVAAPGVLPAIQGLPAAGVSAPGMVPTAHRRIITAAGVSAGIDTALRLTELLADRTAAQAAQLLIEYDPQPPFDCGARPEPGDEVMARVWEYDGQRQ